MPQLTIEELHNYWLEHFPEDCTEPFCIVDKEGNELNGEEIRADILMEIMIQAEIDYINFIYSSSWNEPAIFKCWWEEK